MNYTFCLFSFYTYLSFLSLPITSFSFYFILVVSFTSSIYFAFVFTQTENLLIEICYQSRTESCLKISLIISSFLFIITVAAFYFVTIPDFFPNGAIYFPLQWHRSSVACFYAINLKFLTSIFQPTLIYQCCKWNKLYYPLIGKLL